MARSTLSIKRRALAAVAGGASLAIVLTACSSSGDGGDAGDTEAATADCAAYEEYVASTSGFFPCFFRSGL